MLEEVAHLTTALAEERDHVHVRLGLSRNHAEQGALANSRTREDPDALAPPDGQRPVDRADRCLERAIDHLSLQRMRRLPNEGHASHRFDLSPAVDRMTEAVEDATEEPGTDIDAERAAKRLHHAPRVQPTELS